MDKEIAKYKGWSIARYTANDKESWDNFVKQSRNGTFLFLRNYMEYHSHRFSDCSLIVSYNNNPVVLIPGNISENCFFSHQGLTYGGMICLPHTTLLQAKQAMDLAIEYLKKEHGVTRIVYRAIPHIYHKTPSEEDLYILTRLGATLVSRSVSSVMRPDACIPFRALRRRQLQKARINGLTIVEDDDYSAFWSILERNLNERHGLSPVHSLEEITELHNNFPRSISLFRVLLNEQTVGGCVVYETSEVAHVQYIAASEWGRKYGALDLLFHHLISVRYAQKAYFDLGISCEDSGTLLNEGLLFQKEGFGARAVMYDVYELKL